MNEIRDRKTDKKFLQALKGEKFSSPPIWLMRQAGRYLPEYMEIRSQAGSFLNLCYSPKMACEVTLQPIRRYGFDAAILFSDILVVPDALGQEVRFETGEGPRLDPITDISGLNSLDENATPEKFEIVYEAVELIRASLPTETALIGFCGAPWTVATYMVAGQGTTDQAPAKKWAYSQPEEFQQLINLLVDVSVRYLAGQIDAGVEVVQIFDSWAGSLSDDQFEKWVIKPNAEIVNKLRKVYPDIPIIGFPRQAGPMYEKYISKVDVNAVSCDTGLSLDWIARKLQPKVTVQGNLDPICLIAGGEQMADRVRQIKSALSGGGHIFNLGHGILPVTPPENVARLIEIVREDDKS